MLTTHLLLAVMTLIAPNSKSSGFYVGTYTSPGGSQGIYHGKLNSATGELTVPDLAAQVSDPSFVALDSKGKFLYAAIESSEGQANAYAIGPDHKLTLLNSQTAKAPGPCHISVDPKRHAVLMASYGGGAGVSFPIKADGSLESAATVFQNSGTGPNHSRQDGPHMHSATADSMGKFVYMCDLGTDEIFGFKFHEATLIALKPRSTHTPPGSGPRHLAFRPDGKYLYVNSEMTSEVGVYTVNTKTGALALIQTISTLPKSADANKNTTAEIKCHPNGKWLYVSNRGHDSIAVYKISPDGKLAIVEIHPAGVSEPRGFDLDPSGKWLVVAGQNSNDLSSIAIEPLSGKLKNSGHHIAMSKPVCVAFDPQ